MMSPLHAKRPFHSASPLDYDVCVLLTRHLLYMPMNLSNTSTTIVTISLSSNTKFNAYVQSHANSNPVSSHQTNPVAFHLLSHATLPSALYHLLCVDTSVFYPILHIVPTSLNPYLLLLFDGPTLVTN